MEAKVIKKDKSEVQLNVTVPKDKVKKAYTKRLEELAKNSNIQGFRKGLAPIKLVEEKADKSKLYSTVINDLLQKYYPQALKEKKISPVSNPKVEIKEFDLEKDFKFSALIATEPPVKIDNYKKEIANLYNKQKKEFDEKNKNQTKTHFHLSTGLVIQKLTDLAEVEVSGLLIDEETNRIFAQLIQQTQAVGMSMEDYLKSQNTDANKLRDKYKKIAEQNVKAEFILNHLIKQENINVLESEINKAINAIGDEKIKEKMSTPFQKAYIRNILAKNKLLHELTHKLEEETKNINNKGEGEKEKGEEEKKEKKEEEEKEVRNDKKKENEKK